LSLLNSSKAPLQLLKAHKDNKIDLLHSVRPNDSFSTKSVFPMDIFTSPSQLALMSLEYDAKWCKRLKTVYSDAVRSRELQGNNTNNNSKITHPGVGVLIKTNQVKHVYPDKKLEASFIDQTKSCGGDLYKNVVASNVLMFSSKQCSNLEMEKDKKTKKFEDKCDPLQLATVYQALHDEVFIFIF